MGEVLAAPGQADRCADGVRGGPGDPPPVGRARPQQRRPGNGFGGSAQPGGRGLGAQGKLAQAQAAFEENLAISRRLAGQDPEQRRLAADLAVAHSRVGEHVGRPKASWREAERRSRRPWRSAGGWPRKTPATPTGNGCYRGYNRVGGVLEAQGKLTEALAAFEEDLAISRRLAGKTPTTPAGKRDWRRRSTGWASVGRRKASWWRRRQRSRRTWRSRRRLAEQDPSNAGWQADLVIACVRIARLHSHSGRHSAALPLYEEAIAILGAFRDGAPGSADWAEAKETVEFELASCLSQVEQGERSRASEWTPLSRPKMAILRYSVREVLNQGPAVSYPGPGLPLREAVEADF